MERCEKSWERWEENTGGTDPLGVTFLEGRFGTRESAQILPEASLSFQKLRLFGFWSNVGWGTEDRGQSRVVKMRIRVVGAGLGS